MLCLARLAFRVFPLLFVSPRMQPVAVMQIFGMSDVSFDLMVLTGSGKACAAFGFVGLAGLIMCMRICISLSLSHIFLYHIYSFIHIRLSHIFRLSGLALLVVVCFIISVRRCTNRVSHQVTPLLIRGQSVIVASTQMVEHVILVPGYYFVASPGHHMYPPTHRALPACHCVGLRRLQDPPAGEAWRSRIRPVPAQECQDHLQRRHGNSGHRQQSHDPPGTPCLFVIDATGTEHSRCSWCPDKTYEV